MVWCLLCGQFLELLPISYASMYSITSIWGWHKKQWETFSGHVWECMQMAETKDHKLHHCWQNWKITTSGCLHPIASAIWRKTWSEEMNNKHACERKAQKPDTFCLSQWKSLKLWMFCSNVRFLWWSSNASVLCGISTWPLALSHTQWPKPKHAWRTAASSTPNCLRKQLHVQHGRGKYNPSSTCARSLVSTSQTPWGTRRRSGTTRTKTSSASARKSAIVGEAGELQQPLQNEWLTGSVLYPAEDANLCAKKAVVGKQTLLWMWAHPCIIRCSFVLCVFLANKRLYICCAPCRKLHNVFDVGAVTHGQHKCKFMFPALSSNSAGCIVCSKQQCAFAF